jgi:hypothetical protein
MLLATKHTYINDYGDIHLRLALCDTTGIVGEFEEKKFKNKNLLSNANPEDLHRRIRFEN